jgi:phosphoadenosine phosphosulfate reductase
MHPNQNPKLDDPALLASLEANRPAQGRPRRMGRRAAGHHDGQQPRRRGHGAHRRDRHRRLPIEIFSLDTGRLPLETYDLMAKVQQHYGLKLKFFYPQHEAVEAFTREHGINAFYDSVELRKACCHARKVEPSAARWPASRPGSPACAPSNPPPAPTCPSASSTRATASSSSTRWPTGPRRKSGPTSG